MTLKTSEQGKGEIEGTESKKTERLLPNVKGRGETHNRGRRRRDVDGQRWSDREQKCSDWTLPQSHSVLDMELQITVESLSFLEMEILNQYSTELFH